ncbi:hypothetical protein DAPPUDRAFT_330859 [Daphnia pulex]|uniref:Uncharacterized protein n=1 Tax=Daphnia pulex TaxID=6669 RepID=E9HKV2_DAPPU|nr:hypothetical protein DAPPUDRAFT_330859 [Daphnia pulex]|eukprot:EFX67589.1 hypothetical protein DAPPUDRAFT_330859 [Daphnia pulex]
MNELTSSIFGCPSDNQYQIPSSYTGEDFGVEYLYKLSDPSFKLGSNLEEDIDGGFNDEEIAATTALVSTDEGDFDAELDVATTAFLQSNIEDKEGEVPLVTTDFKSIQGWDKVVQLAKALVDVTEPITNLKGESHKNSIRVEEIKILLQGGKLLTVDLCATEPLLSANDRPTQSSQLSNNMVFEEPQDNTGLAQVRRRQSAPSNNEDNHLTSQEEIAKKPEIDQFTIVVIDNPELLISPAISRTTAWRKRKNPLTGSAGKEKEQERKAYTCNKCQQPMTTTNGHSQLEKGSRTTYT